MRPERLGVIGLGAVGGSLAQCATRAGVEVVGMSRIPAHASQAARRGMIHDVAVSMPALLRRVEMVVLCAPPAANVHILQRHAAELRDHDVLVTDVSSVQRPMARAAANAELLDRFAGSHPLCSTDAGGLDAARPELLRGVPVYVATDTPGEDAAREVGHFWESVCDATAVFISPAEHDALVASSEHLPRAVSSALARCLAQQGNAGANYATGAAALVRHSIGDPALWAGILTANREALVPLIDACIEEMTQLRKTLADADGEGLETRLAEAREFVSRMRGV